MPNCKEFQELSVKEKWEYVGKVVHSIQNDSRLFAIGCDIINRAEKSGVLDDVLINPPQTQEPQSY
jgi:stalled ribosome rescue protein Dom34